MERGYLKIIAFSMNIKIVALKPHIFEHEFIQLFCFFFYHFGDSAVGFKKIKKIFRQNSI